MGSSDTNLYPGVSIKATRNEEDAKELTPADGATRNDLAEKAAGVTSISQQKSSGKDDDHPPVKDPPGPPAESTLSLPTSSSLPAPTNGAGREEDVGVLSGKDVAPTTSLPEDPRPAEVFVTPPHQTAVAIEKEQPPYHEVQVAERSTPSLATSSEPPAAPTALTSSLPEPPELPPATSVPSLPTTNDRTTTASDDHRVGRTLVGAPTNDRTTTASDEQPPPKIGLLPYHETQPLPRNASQTRHCLVACLNNLFGFSKFTKQDLNDTAEALKNYGGNSTRTLFGGNFDADVVLSCLETCGVRAEYWLGQEILRAEAPAGAGKDEFIGLLITHPPDYSCQTQLIGGRHWATIRLVGNDWWLLDSLASKPEPLEGPSIVTPARQPAPQGPALVRELLGSENRFGSAEGDEDDGTRSSLVGGVRGKCFTGAGGVIPLCWPGVYARPRVEVNSVDSFLKGKIESGSAHVFLCWRGSPPLGTNSFEGGRRAEVAPRLCPFWMPPLFERIQ